MFTKLSRQRGKTEIPVSNPRMFVRWRSSKEANFKDSSSCCAVPQHQLTITPPGQGAASSSPAPTLLLIHTCSTRGSRASHIGFLAFQSWLSSQLPDNAYPGRQRMLTQYLSPWHLWSRSGHCHNLGTESTHRISISLLLKHTN